MSEVDAQLNSLEALRNSCITNIQMDVLLPAVPAIFFLLLAVGSLVIGERVLGSVALALFVVSFYICGRLGKTGDADQYRRIFSVSSRLAFALESQSPADIRSMTRDSLDKLERSAVAAANPNSVHYHSRLAIAALNTLKRVGDERTVRLIAELLVPQRCSEEQRGVLDALIDCSNGIRGRLYRQSGEINLLRPAAIDGERSDVLLRPASSQSVLPSETLLRPTTGSTAGPE